MRRVAVSVIVLALLVSAGCAAGDVRFADDTPAGFWVGIWHGAISFITLLVGIFTDTVDVYETANTGGWYDFGFLFGVSAIWGGGSSSYYGRRERTRRAREWNELSDRVQHKLKRKIRQWADAEPDDEWDVVETLAEQKLKRKVRAWADED